MKHIFCLPKYITFILVLLQGIYEKGSDDVVSAACVYRGIDRSLTFYPSAHTQLRRHHPNPYREFPFMFYIKTENKNTACIACIAWIANQSIALLH